MKIRYIQCGWISLFGLSLAVLFELMQCRWVSMACWNLSIILILVLDSNTWVTPATTTRHIEFCDQPHHSQRTYSSANTAMLGFLGPQDAARFCNAWTQDPTPTQLHTNPAHTSAQSSLASIFVAGGMWFGPQPAGKLTESLHN